MIKWSKDLDYALRLLYEKTHKSKTYNWYFSYHDDDYNLESITCGICNTDFYIKDYLLSTHDLVVAVREHGLNHLKEHNLLAFL